MTDDLKAPGRIWAFDRYVNGVLMAEGVTITRASSFEEACVKAAKLASRGPNDEAPVLVLANETADRIATLEAALADMTRQRDKWEAAHDDLVAEIARLTAEVTQLRADLANAGAVMVEACAQTADGYHQRALEWAKKIRGLEQYIDETDSSRIAADIRALSTLSPIAAAAGVLLADPDTLDGFKGYILNRHDMDTTMSDYAEGAMDYLRALAEQEKVE